MIQVGDAVQFRFEPGTGGVVQQIDGETALVDTPRGEREVPTDALRKVRPEHEARVRKSVQIADPERACMHSSGCVRKATHFQEDAAHWHDWIWCDEHAHGKNTEPLYESKP